jgi:hypothetical protein
VARRGAALRVSHEGIVGKAVGEEVGGAGGGVGAEIGAFVGGGVKSV